MRVSEHGEILPEDPGEIGTLCGLKTKEKIVRKTPHGPWHQAVCNRWMRHQGNHRQTRGRDFRVQAEWTDDDCPDPTVAVAQRLHAKVTNY